MTKLTIRNFKRFGEVEIELGSPAQSSREKSIRHGHISTLHTWSPWKRSRLR